MTVTIDSLSKAYGGRDLFKEFSLEIADGTRLAVAGPNGTGKTTLLKMIAGESFPDSGRVIMPRAARIGYVAQELGPETLEKSLLEFIMEVLPSWNEFWEDWEKAHERGDEAAMNRLTAKQADLETRYGYNPEHRAHAVLSGLGFETAVHERKLGSFSGGWRERAKLARVLTAGADVLILDEPTNHLDLEAVEWLEQFLLAYEGVLVFVAHDRVFLDNVATHVLFLGGSRPLVRKGSFSSFIAWSEEMEEQRAREAKRLSDEIERKMEFVKRFKAKATKARQAGSRQKQAERLEKELAGKRPEPRRKTLAFKWPEPPEGDKIACQAMNLTMAWPGREPIWENLDFTIYKSMRVAIAGVNGSGKSTLLKCLAGDLTPTAGRIEIGSKTRVGYFSQHQHEILDPSKSVLGEIRRLADPRTTEEELMSVLGLFLLGQEYFERTVESLSGGEKNRLVLASLFLARANFLILDEPTNHLDLESREALGKALEDFSGTVLLVAHDRWLLSTVPTQVWALEDHGLVVHEDGFEGYERARKAAAHGETEEPAAVSAQPAQGDDSAPELAVRKETREEAKQRKREEAARRNAMHKKLKPKKDAYAKKEAELEKVLNQMGEAETALADPDVYADHAKSAELMDTYTKTKDRSERLFDELQQLESEIQALEAEFAEEAV
ncbi:ABC-F family ATP-binding cassette domain-containing protein [Oceanidesulfovibrio marinus]|uniref:ABC transporter ATP-binding protein n=1 Tax=Oceanidesulfovibrio marinus TaxID=370038 RepID=A0A6P1ZGQ5_9BACT|nr:ABC-F family ATP-binding cassette domain-containing protein [Oceanidesulfovibrio marinus]QJT10584.1 ATP-binding cassette domain-containing protein [Oceanidesulfovibrio marinus]TVM34184.1 ABC transporter ATP-binding protein [Oceanidesulfovibrio marinus]